MIPHNVESEIKRSSVLGCEKCRGTGFVTIEKDGYLFMDKCECYARAQFNKMQERSNIPEIYRGANFELDESVSCLRFKPSSYKPVQITENGEIRTKQVLQFDKSSMKLDINMFGKQYVDVAKKHLNANPRVKSVGLLLTGFVGSGKTMFACSVANAFIEQGYNVSYLKTKQYLDNVIKDSFSRDASTAAKLKDKRDYLNGFKDNFKDNCHLLVLDELGYEYQKSDSGFSLSEIKDLLRNRAEKCLPTIITTNFMLDELVKIYEEEIVSMFAQSYLFVCVVCSDDYRIKKSEELDEDFDFDSMRG